MNIDTAITLGITLIQAAQAAQAAGSADVSPAVVDQLAQALGSDLKKLDGDIASAG